MVLISFVSAFNLIIRSIVMVVVLVVYGDLMIVIVIMIVPNIIIILFDLQMVICYRVLMVMLTIFQVEGHHH